MKISIFPSPLYLFPWMNAWGNHFKMLLKKKNAGAVAACVLVTLAFIFFKISSDCRRPYKTLVNSFFILSCRCLQNLGGSELVIFGLSLSEPLRAVQKHYFLQERENNNSYSNSRFFSELITFQRLLTYPLNLHYQVIITW